MRGSTGQGDGGEGTAGAVREKGHHRAKELSHRVARDALRASEVPATALGRGRRSRGPTEAGAVAGRTQGFVRHAVIGCFFSLTKVNNKGAVLTVHH